MRAAPRDPGGSAVWIRSALYAGGSAVSIVVWALLSLLTAPLPLRLRYRFITLWTRFNLRWLRWTCGLRHEVRGVENIPPGPAIVMSKHQSAWETMGLQLIFPPQTWVLKRGLLWVPFFGWALALLRPVAIDRKAGRRAVEQLVEQGTRRLRAGLWLVIFPEGTRVAPGRTGRYRIGGAVLAQRSGYPIVPVAHNAGDYWPRRGFLKRPGVIQVVIGPPVDPHDKGVEEIIAEVRDRIEGEMPAISPAYHRNT